MENAVGMNHRVRFKAFELDLHTRELYRNGIRLRLQGQPIDVLEMLLEQPGELVTREQLRKKLWPEDTFVDFEHSLNSTINRLRDALGDRAEDPKFIETLPRLGYRFVAPVENGNGRISATDPSLKAAGSSMPVLAVVPISEGTTEAPRTWLKIPRWALAFGIVVAIGITAAAAWWEWWSVYPVPHVTSIDRITNDGIPKYWPATDGTRIYFFEKLKNHVVVAQVSSSGGDTSTIPTPFALPGVLDIAPDSSSLLIIDGRPPEPSPLWIVPLPQGAPRSVGSVVAEDATFTPNGKQVIFATGAEIWIGDLNGSHVRKLWTAPGTVIDPRVSIDGMRMRFSACGLSGCALWEARTDGSGAHRLLPGWQEPPHEFAGGWSPDGRYYVFGVIIPKGAFHQNLWVLPERRGWFSRSRPKSVQLTHGPLCFFPPIAFSPDGRTLFSVGQKDDSELVRYDPRTRRVVPFLSGVPATMIDFSRDGQWIVYITSPPYPSLWRSRRDGSERVQLTSSDDSQVGIARWSPDDKRIAFEWSRAGQETKLALISRDGGTPEQLIPDKEDSHDQSDPTWSPDGKEIIFARGWTRRSEERMVLLRVDLRTRKVVTVPGSEGLFSPRWSPDGRYLSAFTVDLRSIRLFDFQKQVWTTWFTAQEEIGGNVWSKDGRALYFLNRRTKDAPLAWFRIGLKERTPTKLMELPDERILGWWYGLESDGSSSYFTRDLTSTEIYAIHLSDK